MTPSPAPASVRVQVKHRTGARAGRVLSREIRYFRAPTLLSEAEGNTHRTDVPPLVELPLVDAGAVVMAPVENPGGDPSPHVARMRAARIGLRITARA